MRILSRLRPYPPLQPDESCLSTLRPFFCIVGRRYVGVGCSINKACQGFADAGLEGGRSISQAKRHNILLEIAIARARRSLPLFASLDRDMMIRSLQIEHREVSGTPKPIRCLFLSMTASEPRCSTHSPSEPSFFGTSSRSKMIQQPDRRFCIWLQIDRMLNAFGQRSTRHIARSDDINQSSNSGGNIKKPTYPIFSTPAMMLHGSPEVLLKRPRVSHFHRQHLALLCVPTVIISTVDHHPELLSPGPT